MNGVKSTVLAERPADVLPVPVPLLRGTAARDYLRQIRQRQDLAANPDQRMPAGRKRTHRHEPKRKHAVLFA